MNNYSIKWSNGLVLNVSSGCVFTIAGSNQVLKDFGCANGMPRGWFDQFKGMKDYQFEVGRCLTRYIVPEAGITYTIDSSD
jgi:hypothetical protein